MSTRYSLRQTPRKKELFDGMVQTPARRSTRRKSQFPVEADGDSSSAAESEVNGVNGAQKDGATRLRRGIPKFKEHIDEDSDETESTAPEALSQDTDTMAQPQKRTGRTVSSDISAPAAVKETVKETASSTAANGTADAKEKPLIDGWRPGLDHRKDYSGHFEFGGPLGVTAMMIGFPILMWYMWIGATYYDGKFPFPEEGEDWADFGRHMVDLVYTGAFPHAKAWAMYWVFLVFEALLYCFAPGVWGKGKPLRHEGGRQLDYYCSAQWSWYITIISALALHFTGVMPLYTIIDEFGPLLSVAILSGVGVSLALYASAHLRGAQHRITGNFFYDLFMGVELNPRLFGVFDFKMFFEVRLPWYILFLLTCGTAARQYDRYGYVSGECCFLLMAHFLYANACSKGEELIITTWDMYYEKLGFMLTFWNMAGVPLSYCHCTIFLANHHPDEYHWSKPVLAVWFVAYLFWYWVWDTTNSQKNRFRAQERGHLIMRKSFPQLPWQTIENPRVIKTATGDSILADGWYGKARKIHYTADWFFAASWGLITGFTSPFPYFYPVFFTLMISHRAWRDIEHCRLKYGESWKEYEKLVPYLFIPYII